MNSAYMMQTNKIRLIECVTSLTVVSKTNQQENLAIFHREMINHRQDENLNGYILSQTLTSHWMGRKILHHKTARIYSISLLMWNLQFELFLQSHNNLNFVQPIHPVLNLSGNGHFESPANHITMKSSQN